MSSNRLNAPARTSNYFLVLAYGCLAAAAVQADDAVQVNSRAALVAAIQKAAPGDRILIAPGVYRGGITFDNLRGAVDHPIVVAAANPEQPPTIEGGASCLHLRSAQHVELRNLSLRKATGNGLNIDDGSVVGSCSHITLHGISVEDIGPKGNRDGIKLSGVDKFLIQDCQLQRWGEGGSAIDMVGCHSGRIENCSFTFRSDIFGNGVQTKGGSADIIVRRCRFTNAGSRSINLGGSTGRPYFRPPNANYEAKNITVEDCTFVGSGAPIAFVGVDGATVRYNTIYRPQRWVVRILQESQGSEFIPCRNGFFANNLIAYRRDEVRSIVNVGGGTQPDSFRFAKNHWHCIDGPQTKPQLPSNETDSVYGDPLFRSVERGDLRLSTQSSVRDAGVRPRQ